MLARGTPSNTPTMSDRTPENGLLQPLMAAIHPLHDKLCVLTARIAQQRLEQDPAGRPEVEMRARVRDLALAGTAVTGLALLVSGGVSTSGATLLAQAHLEELR